MATSSGIAHTAIITLLMVIRIQLDTRCISRASSRPSDIVRSTQTTTKTTVRTTTPQNSPSPSTEVYWSRPTHGGAVPDQRLLRRSSWKDSTMVSTSG